MKNPSQFVCLGYSVYGDAAAAPPKKGGPSLPGPGDPDDDVALPQCLGVQIIRAQAARGAPLEAGVGTAAAAASKAADGPAATRPPRRDPRARGVDGPPSLPSLPDALAALPDAAGRLGRSARRVADQMGRNAGAGLAAARKAAESLADAVLPGRDK
jgi:hypothetical protein